MKRRSYVCVAAMMACLFVVAGTALPGRVMGAQPAAPDTRWTDSRGPGAEPGQDVTNWDGAIQLSNTPSQAHTDEVNGRNVAVDPSGRIHVVWEGNSTREIRYRRWTPGSGWAAQETVISGGQTSAARYPCIAADAADNVHVVWTYNSRLWYKMCTPTGNSNSGWEDAAFELSATKSSRSAHVACTPDGHVHVVWVGSDNALCYREKIGGTWQTAVTNLYGTTAKSDPCVAGDANNDVHVAWHQGSPSQILYANRIGGTWLGAAENVSNATAAQLLASLAINPGTGAPHLVWRGLPPSGTERRVIHSYRTGVNTWAARETLSIGLGTDDNSDQPQMVFTANGAGHAVWSKDGALDIWYSERSVAGVWGTPVNLTNISATARMRVSIGNGGSSPNPNDLHVVWEDYPKPPGTNYQVVYKHGVSVVPPAAPALNQPGDNVNQKVLRPTLSVTSMTDVDKYEFNIYDAPGAVAPVRSGQVDHPTVSWTVPTGQELTDRTQYWWTCRAYNAAGWGPEATRRNFIVWMPPVLESPVGGAEVADKSPTLTIGAVGSATGYEFKVYDAGGSTPIRTYSGTGNTWDVAPDLVNGQDYDWTGAVENARGWSDPSGKESFKVRILPGNFSLTLPVNDALDQPVTGIAFDWGDAADVTTYDLYLGQTNTNPPGPAVAPGLTASQWTYSGAPLEYEKDYYWRVKAVGPGGFKWAGTGNFHFKTEAEMPAWPESWHEVRPMPKAPTDKAPKDGAWMALHAAGADVQPVIYVAKGNKATDFYMYAPAEGDSGTWYEKAAIPANEGTRTKPPSKGCVGVSDGLQYVYMTKGNNTLGFWRYNAGTNHWDSMAGVPEGDYGKRVKGGTDAVYAMYKDTGCVYLLKGYKTEFYRYNTLAGRWDTLPEVPYGANKQKYDKGSFLGYDETNKLIYAHQAKYYDKTLESPNHYMFKYDVAADSWYHAPLSGIPVYGLEGGREHKKKKSADGAAGAWSGTNLYALKGGNTQGFFKYFPGPDTWHQLDTVPGNGSFGKKKRVKAGGDLVSYGGGAFFALKGNKTYEVWRYMEGTLQASRLTPYARDGIAGDSRLQIAECRMQIAPNPIAGGFATLRIQGFQGSRGQVANLRVYDALGRCVLVRPLVIGDWSLGIPLDLRRLSAGVYLVRLDAEGATQTQKLVVQR